MPRLSKLPSSVIHGDANDHNVIVEGEKVVGLIDFGDMIHSFTVGDLAIAIAYVVLDKSDPLACAKDVVAGYMSESTLSDDELDSVWLLTLMRLSMSVCLAAHQQRQKPENEYLDISQRSIRDSLARLLAIDPREATNVLRG
jgi:Ser/Thr protein kinase RdoA (MazF antagonist)